MKRHIGSEAQVQQIFQDAGWVKVDRDTKNAVLHGVLASISKESYLTMPMSQLYLFGRPQDYGFAHAEPLTVVTTRHHLRIWKSTLTVGGQPLWVGAATHDMGLERDQRNGKLTHHIDPNVDDERESVNRSLTATGYVGQHITVLPSDPIQDAKTATGCGPESYGSTEGRRPKRSRCERPRSRCVRRSVGAGKQCSHPSRGRPIPL